MSFLNITDPKKRDKIVQDFLKTKRNILQQSRQDTAMNFQKDQELQKNFAPLVSSQMELSDKIISSQRGLSDTIIDSNTDLADEITNAINRIPPQLAIEPSQPKDLGPIAQKYLKKSLEGKQTHDSVFGIRSANNRLMIGNKQVFVDGDDIIIENIRYKGTVGLWELLTRQNPNAERYSDDDKKEYREILLQTNAIFKNYDPTSARPRSSRGEKWKNIISPIWMSIKGSRGSGTIILSSDPNALISRLELLLASHRAGNTGVTNEVISILDELLRQKNITKENYKRIVLGIK